MIALGIVPVGMSAGYTADIYPWAADALARFGTSRPTMLRTADGLPMEQIAALDPELIVATTCYDLPRFRQSLERIAPVLGPTTTASEETWQQTTLRVGAAVGRAEQARMLTETVDAELASLRAAHPTWAGRTFTFGPVIPGQQLYTVSSATDPSAALLSQLGLVLSPRVVALPQIDDIGRANVSLEKLDVLNADVLMLVHFGTREAQTSFEQAAVFEKIAAVRRRAYLAIEPHVAMGLAFPSALSIPYSMGRIVPRLEVALDRDKP